MKLSKIFFKLCRVEIWNDVSQTVSLGDSSWLSNLKKILMSLSKFGMQKRWQFFSEYKFCNFFFFLFVLNKNQLISWIWENHADIWKTAIIRPRSIIFKQKICKKFCRGHFGLDEAKNLDRSHFGLDKAKNLYRSHFGLDDEKKSYRGHFGPSKKTFIFLENHHGRYRPNEHLEILFNFWKLNF